VCSKALAALVGLFACITRSLYTHEWLAAVHAVVSLVLLLYVSSYLLLYMCPDTTI
jgi:hypothetical protein